jgi:hypothetical protein
MFFVLEVRVSEVLKDVKQPLTIFNDRTVLNDVVR